jgi:hypothetical protein
VRAEIAFADGSRHVCSGRVVSGQSVPFVDEDDVRRHVARVNALRGTQDLKVIRIIPCS